MTSNNTKPLRFVTNYGAPHPKRRRIAAACLTCRKRKTACSGEKPQCETCVQNRVDCAGYAPEPPEPKRPYIKQQQRKTSTTGPTDRNLDPRLFPGTQQTTPKLPSSSPLALMSNSHNVSPSRQSLFPGPRNRMPYFRWLGPTAIMPGLKQMVVKIKRHDADGANSSVDGAPFATSPLNHSSQPTVNDIPVTELPFYDTSTTPPSELVTHLAQTFFTHVGCNFPFLPRERFLRDLEDKQVDAILVDAVCALAARFSNHPLLVGQASTTDVNLSAADYGQAFASRAKTALTDTFIMPTIAAAQAALLIAYNEFGESRDSGLWMYLGIAIRLAEDLGLNKLDGMKFKGFSGPTPRSVKNEIDQASTPSGYSRPPTVVESRECSDSTTESEDVAGQMAGEQERVDTFWTILFLDRVVSSGTGRRSTLRDKDIEIAFPPLSEDGDEVNTLTLNLTLSADWPSPFPALIRIIHLYGRVADLLNAINSPSDVTEHVSKRLAVMESQVTRFYQGLPKQLHFDAINFQHFVKHGEGTNFVLLHLWFHTLIVLLHQPTLLKTFQGRLLQLFPNSQQLSMSSAKTIADILSYSQLIDAKAMLGNPFVTQPIYIAACAFLREAAEHSASSNAQSRVASPTRQSATDDNKKTPDNHTLAAVSGHIQTAKRALAKHSLLATAANQHYQLCYTALQTLETYWAGTKYILTVLDQKFKGVGDPVLYTIEESESAVERPNRDPAFNTPGWRRNLKLAANIDLTDIEDRFWSGLQASDKEIVSNEHAKAIGWTMTGDMDSSSTNLAFHYPRPLNDHPTLPLNRAAHGGVAARTPGSFTTDANAMSDASLLLGLHAPLETSQPIDDIQPAPMLTYTGQPAQVSTLGDQNMYDSYNAAQRSIAPGGMHIETQDVNMNMLGLDMLPWFDSIFSSADGDMSVFDLPLPGDGFTDSRGQGSGQFDPGLGGNSQLRHGE